VVGHIERYGRAPIIGIDADEKVVLLNDKGIRHKIQISKGSAQKYIYVKEFRLRHGQNKRRRSDMKGYYESSFPILELLYLKSWLVVSDAPNYIVKIRKLHAMLPAPTRNAILPLIIITSSPPQHFHSSSCPHNP
jgi:hypothetical protein